jgi:heterodisulfide reductase subunit A
LRENLYREARQKGVHFVRYDAEKGLMVEENSQKVNMAFTDRVINRQLSLQPDLVVLASAIVPPDATEISQMFKVPVNEDGFYVEAHVKLRPVDFATDGVFVCGLAHGPKPIDESIGQAQAVAARAANMLSSKTMKLGGVVAEMNLLSCSSCGVCAEVCPFQAIEMDEKNQPVVNSASCKGCGTCAASCRSGAASLKGFSNEAVFSQISAFCN